VVVPVRDRRETDSRDPVVTHIDARPRRTCLSVPASSPKMIERSRALPADQVMLDLEDAVAPDEKDAARSTAIDELERGGWGDRLVSIRINVVGSELGRRDLEALAVGRGRLDSVVVPKVSSAAQVRLIAEALGRRDAGIEAQIEDAAGLAAVEEIAPATERLVALVFGPIDMGASLGIRAFAGDGPEGYSGDVWHYARFRILVSARTAGLAAVDGPSLVLDDLDRVRASAALAAASGYDGKWVIHPSQIDVVNEAFTPTTEELEGALAVLASLDEAAVGGWGAVGAGSIMLDEASRRMAERVVARARAAGMQL
jgi:citrate lyase subunit beta/citryl-CoA lyase